MSADDGSEISSPTLKECIVCWEPARPAVTLACGHVCCTSCVHRALMAARHRCPVCRALTTALEWQPEPEHKATRVVIPRHGGESHMGLSLRDCATGVMVISVERNAAAHGRLRAGARLCALNNIPLVHHRQACALIDACFSHGAPLAFDVTDSTQHPPSARVRLRTLRRLAHGAFHA